MKEKTLKLAQEWGLDEVTITQGMNGYPEGLYKALIGFYTLDDALGFADHIGGEVVLLTKRDGHQFWVNNGRTYQAFDRARFIDENEEEFFSNIESFESWAREEIRSTIGVGGNIYDIRDACIGLCNIADEIYEMRDDEMCIVYKSTYDYKVVDRYVTEIHDNDVTTYAIAVIDGIGEEETEEEED